MQPTTRYSDGADAGDPNPLDSTGLCLLSLDGGGVRGLSTLYILKSLMEKLAYERYGQATMSREAHHEGHATGEPHESWSRAM
jgi:hypothetical protein